MTLVLNKEIIVKTIDMLQTIAKQLIFTDKIVINKVILMRSDLFKVRNIQWTIFRQQTELFLLEKFDWLEPIEKLF